MVQSGMSSDERAAFLEKLERRISSTVSVTISEGRRVTIPDLALRFREDWGQDWHRDVLCPLQLQDTFQLLRLFPRFVVVRGCVEVREMSKAAAECCDTIRQTYANGKAKGKSSKWKQFTPSRFATSVHGGPARLQSGRLSPIPHTSAPMPRREGVLQSPHPGAIWLHHVRRAVNTNVLPSPAHKPLAQKSPKRPPVHVPAGYGAPPVIPIPKPSVQSSGDSQPPPPPAQLPLLQPKVEPIVKQEEKPPVVNGFQTVLPAPKKEGGGYMIRLREELADVMSDYESPSSARMRAAKADNVAFFTHFIQSSPKPAPRVVPPADINDNLLADVSAAFSRLLLDEEDSFED